MIVTYKYHIGMPPKTKVVNQFIDDVLAKHFEELMLGKRQLLISSWLEPGYGLIVLDIDHRCSGLRRLLNLPFNIEVTPRGYHLVSRFIVDCGGSLDLWKGLRDYFKDYKGIDLVTSFSVNPIKRLGYDAEKDFFYSFVDRLGDRKRYRGMREVNRRLWSRWAEYIRNDLIPYHTVWSYYWVKDLLSKEL